MKPETSSTELVGTAMAGMGYSRPNRVPAKLRGTRYHWLAGKAPRQTLGKAQIGLAAFVDSLVEGPSPPYN